MAEEDEIDEEVSIFGGLFFGSDEDEVIDTG
jgi:hypothetical protein